MIALAPIGATSRPRDLSGSTSIQILAGSRSAGPRSALAPAIFDEVSP